MHPLMVLPVCLIVLVACTPPSNTAAYRTYRVTKPSPPPPPPLYPGALPPNPTGITGNRIDKARSNVYEMKADELQHILQKPNAADQTEAVKTRTDTGPRGTQLQEEPPESKPPDIQVAKPK